ncbi:MAG: DUF4158 domain-containing protein [Chloroflexi bacterium]|nr:DUF4158 domain-containing protein [Chloroflexota bacterium]MBV9598414.1 DUF4158 domain-containing protein [Chloroflexota bacterium]
MAIGGDYNRLGLALQIVTARFLGAFLPDPTNVLAGVIAYVAAQLDVPTTTDLEPYRVGDARWDQAAEIRQGFGYRDFNEQPEHFRLCSGCARERGSARSGPASCSTWPWRGWSSARSRCWA